MQRLNKPFYAHGAKNSQMSNRSYLYVKTPDSQEFKGLSEFAYDIPLSHVLMVSGQCRKVDSHIWDSPMPLALEGDFDLGYKNLFDFLETCHQQNILDDATYQELCKQSHEALDQYLNCKAKVYLELVEIFELEDPDDYEDFDESAYEDEDDAFFAYMLDDVLNTMIKPASGYVKDSLTQLKCLKEQGQTEAIENSLGIEWDEVLFYN